MLRTFVNQEPCQILLIYHITLAGLLCIFRLMTHNMGTYHFVSWLKGFNNPVTYSLKYRQVYFFLLKATAVLFKIQGKAMLHLRILLVADEIVVHGKCSDKMCCPSKSLNRHLFGYNSLFIDQMKRSGTRLIFLISTVKIFASDKGNA